MEKKETENAPRFHYDGCHILDDGKTFEFYVTTADNQFGKIVVPWEEIDRIRKFGWELQEEAGKKAMKGKRIRCWHLNNVNAQLPVFCKIGKDAGPEGVNCITCKYIDGYIEQYETDSKITYDEMETW